MFINYFMKGILQNTDKELRKIEDNLKTPGIKRLTRPSYNVHHKKNDVEIEKKDFAALVLAATIVFGPILLLVIAVFALFILIFT